MAGRDAVEQGHRNEEHDHQHGDPPRPAGKGVQVQRQYRDRREVEEQNGPAHVSAEGIACRAGTEVGVANQPKVCSTAAEGGLSHRTYKTKRATTSLDRGNLSKPADSAASVT